MFAVGLQGDMRSSSICPRWDSVKITFTHIEVKHKFPVYASHFNRLNKFKVGVWVLDALTFLQCGLCIGIEFRVGITYFLH